MAAYSKKKRAQKVQRGLKGKEFQSSEESASEFESSSDEVVESRSIGEVEAVEPETQDTQLSLPARKDLPWVWLPLTHEGKWTPFPGVQILKWRPTDLPVPRGVLRELQKKRGLGHIYIRCRTTWKEIGMRMVSTSSATRWQPQRRVRGSCVSVQRHPVVCRWRAARSLRRRKGKREG